MLQALGAQARPMAWGKGGLACVQRCCNSSGSLTGWGMSLTHQRALSPVVQETLEWGCPSRDPRL